MIKKIALIGSPVKHSFSPLMHNSAFDACGLPYIYESIEVSPHHFEESWNDLKKSNYVGFNVTLPHKENAWKCADEVALEVRFVESVNTMFFKNQMWFGYNTDMAGFLKPLQSRKKFFFKKKIIVLGAGGSAKAVAVALASQQIKQLSLVNRTLSRAEKLQRLIQKHFPHVLCTVNRVEKEVFSSADMIVNTTPIGMNGDDFNLFPFHWIRKGILCYDLIYTQERTPFLQKAFEQGAFLLNGLEMLLWQGVYAWEIWMGCQAPVSVMRKALVQALENKSFC